MSYQICSAHGCKLIPITDDKGEAVIAMDCPKCMEFERELKINFGSEQPTWGEQNNAGKYD